MISRYQRHLQYRYRIPDRLEIPEPLEILPVRLMGSLAEQERAQEVQQDRHLAELLQVQEMAPAPVLN